MADNARTVYDEVRDLAGWHTRTAYRRAAAENRSPLDWQAARQEWERMALASHLTHGRRGILDTEAERNALHAIAAPAIAQIEALDRRSAEGAK